MAKSEEEDAELDNRKHVDRALVGALKGLASIPIIGTVIIGAWDGYWDSRMEDTVNRLSQAIKEMDESKVDKDFLASEEGLDLFRKALHIRMLSRSQLKAKFILGLLRESLHKDRDKRFNTSLKEVFLSIIGQLTDEDMIFLQEFCEGKYDQKSRTDIYEIGRDKGVALDHLLSPNLLREDDTWEKHIVKSVLGEEFLAYLQVLAKEESFCL